MKKSIVLGGGCFWCTEAIFQRVRGVERAVPGYAGGDFEDPSYADLHNHDTGHAEVIRLTYDDDIIDLATLLKMFWHIHNPTTPNRQGNDVGSQYRSIILYENEEDKQVIEESLEKVAKPLWEEPVVTEIKKLDTFYEAENYHQNYFEKNPQNMYCQVVINPKLGKFQTEFADWLAA